MTQGDRTIRPVLRQTEQPEHHRMYLVVKTMAYLGIPAHTAFIPLFAWLDVPFMAVFNVFSVAVWISGWHLNRRGRQMAAVNLMTSEAALHAVLATYFLGWESGFAYYLMPIIPATMFNEKLKTRVVLLVAGVLCVMFAALYAYTSRADYGRFDPLVLEIANYANIAIVFAALGIITYYFRKGSVAAEKRMEELAGTDLLTLLPNRRHLMEFLESERRRCERNGAPFVLLLTDVDHFKRINDTHGHNAGDFVLHSIAGILRQCLRQQDTVGRWGGEEFLAILPDTSLEQGRLVAERMRWAIEHVTLEYDDKPLQITMTFGLGVYSPAMSLTECLKLADDALYNGKASGRNRVICVADGQAA